MLHQGTKHIEVDLPFIQGKIALEVIFTEYVDSKDWLAVVFTKSHGQKTFYDILGELAMNNIFPHFQGEYWEYWCSSENWYLGYFVRDFWDIGPVLSSQRHSYNYGSLIKHKDLCA